MLSINTAAHLAGAIIFSAVAGIGIARTTVGEMTSPSAAAMETSVGAPACLECSDRRRGYLWASSEKISSLGACGDASWEFREGCGDYLADRRGT